MLRDRFARTRAMLASCTFPDVDDIDIAVCTFASSTARTRRASCDRVFVWVFREVDESGT
jgi:hypothetical protein